MSSQGVIYFNRGSKCLIRLLVSVRSLRKHWSGNVALIYEDCPEWCAKELSKSNVQLIPISRESGITTLARKSQLWKYTPYKTTLFLDSDTLICQPIDSIFDMARKHGFVVTQFCDWVTSGRKIKGRISEWEKVIGREETDKAINYGKAVNTGVFAWHGTPECLKEWERITLLGDKANCTHRMVDELGCQVILHRIPHYMAPQEWNASVRYSKPDTKPIIIHYHGFKHVLDVPNCDPWKQAYWDMIHSTDAPELIDSHGDRRLKSYVKTTRKSDVTIVTAVNQKYIERFKTNFPKWLQTIGLREQNYLIFAHTDCYQQIKELYPRFKVVEWSWPIAGNNVREEMLSAFVFGTSVWVKTKFWMKLDCDCTPKASFVWPDYGNYTICAHAWRFTKQKGDPDMSTHWLNRLDSWFGDVPIFKDKFDPIKDRRVGHKRFCTFCCIEKTDFTRRLAKKCGDRLPIPSQDTTSWYAAERWSEKVLRMNFKEYLSP